MLSRVYFCASFSMNKVRNIFYNLLIFFCLSGLLLASSPVSSCFAHSKSEIKKESRTKNKSEFTLKSVTVEATVSTFQVLLQPYLVHTSSPITVITNIFIPSTILSPAFTSTFLTTLFTRIAPNKAP